MKRTVLILMTIAWSIQMSPAQEMTVPVPVQVTLIKKILNFDLGLKDKPDVTVIVIYAEGGEDMKNAVVTCFQRAGFKTLTAPTDQVAGKLSEASVAYLLASTHNVQQACANGKVLSFSGVKAVVSGGSPSIALGEEDGKPKIDINLSQLKAEGHNFSSDFLRLARMN